MKTFAKVYFFSSCLITLFAGLVLMVFIPVATSAEGKSPNGHSETISPSDYGQSLQHAGPDSPGASGEDHGRAASFRADLEANGFLVRSGQMTPIDPIVDLLDSGIGDSANGNNAGQPYKVLEENHEEINCFVRISSARFHHTRFCCRSYSGRKRFPDSRN